MKLNNMPRFSLGEPWLHVLLVNPLMYLVASRFQQQETYYFVSLIALCVGCISVILWRTLLKGSKATHYIAGLGINWAALSFIISQATK